MTREEREVAIKVIRNFPVESTGERKAVLTAIKALEQEPCEDAISRQAVLDTISRIGLCKCSTNEVQAVDECLRAVEDLPPVNPQPKTGHWIFDEILDKHYYCSECKSMGVDYWDFCPYCGAKMVEPQESEGKE